MYFDWNESHSKSIFAKLNIASNRVLGDPCIPISFCQRCRQLICNPCTPYNLCSCLELRPASDKTCSHSLLHLSKLFSRSQDVHHLERLANNNSAENVFVTDVFVIDNNDSKAMSTRNPSAVSADRFDRPIETCVFRLARLPNAQTMCDDRPPFGVSGFTD
jgi:hypothetical protein